MNVFFVCGESVVPRPSCVCNTLRLFLGPCSRSLSIIITQLISYTTRALLLTFCLKHYNREIKLAHGPVTSQLITMIPSFDT